MAGATELLRLSGFMTEPVGKVFEQMLSVTSDVEASFISALSILNESLTLATCQNNRITDLKKEQPRLQALAVFRDPIEVFRDLIAGKTGRACWQRLARDLYQEHYNESNPARAEVAVALTHLGLDLSVWDGVRQVADAAVKEFHQGKDMHPKLLRIMVSKGALPEDLHSCNAAMTQMLDWLDNAM